jgi:hypothetical protein
MKEIAGELWDHHKAGVVIAITTNGYVKGNGACVMGRGCAKEARDSFPGIDLGWGSSSSLKATMFTGSAKGLFPSPSSITGGRKPILP